MEFTPFTLAQALEICEDFEDLADTEFKIGLSPVMMVEYVVVSPFGEAERERFVAAFIETKDGNAALGFYTGSSYDVILITSNADDGTNRSYINIREFAALRGIKYEFPENIH